MAQSLKSCQALFCTNAFRASSIPGKLRTVQRPRMGFPGLSATRSPWVSPRMPCISATQKRWETSAMATAEPTAVHADAPGASHQVSPLPALHDQEVGVMLLNMGGPDTLDDVQPFLYNLFADPDIIRLPAGVRWLQPLVATLISRSRAPVSSRGYAAIGGGSPLRAITEAQGEALRAELARRGLAVRPYVAMRYWHPFTDAAVADARADGVRRLVVLPLYPQFSVSTSGSSLRELQRVLAAPPSFAGATAPGTAVEASLKTTGDDDDVAAVTETTENSDAKHAAQINPATLLQSAVVAPSWCRRPGYVAAMADLIQEELAHFPSDVAPEVVVFFSAHGVPVSYVESGDPYRDEMEACVALIAAELGRRGVHNACELAYQSRVGPVEWLRPYTPDSITALAARGVPGLLAVPVSFVSEHIETLEEIDQEYRELALSSGIPNWRRVPALGTHPRFIADLADMVQEALGQRPEEPETSYMDLPTAADIGQATSLKASQKPSLLQRLLGRALTDTARYGGGSAGMI